MNSRSGWEQHYFQTGVPELIWQPLVPALLRKSTLAHPVLYFILELSDIALSNVALAKAGEANSKQYPSFPSQLVMVTELIQFPVDAVYFCCH